jgi:two-component SAPR family response regulator
MPEGVSGIELARKIHEQKPSVKVIFTSGYSADFTESNFGLKERANFLPKPYEPQKLVKMIRECLDRPVD